jgi:hypothetical protein
MTPENLQGLSDLEPLPAEADADTLHLVSESEPELAATEPTVQAQNPPTAIPEKPATPHRRRLGQEDAPPAEASAAPAVLQPTQVRSALAGLRAEQNFILGLAGGTIAAIAGAILWATMTIATGLQIGWMAIGVGAFVGGTIRVLGKGITKPFGYIGATLSLLGCLAGNLLSICVVIAQQHELSLTYVLTHLNPAAIPEAMAVASHPMDLLFYGLAIYAGYRFAFRRVTTADVQRFADEPKPHSGPTPVA